MNALELAEWREHYRDSKGYEAETIAMLRAQHAAIKTLREALDAILCSAAANQAAINYPLIDGGKAALAATEEFQK